MLKVIHFSGTLVADMAVFHKFNVENAIQEAIEDHGGDLHHTSHSIVKPSDIPPGWDNALPYGGERCDDKTCIEIFRDEILPTQPTEDPNQNKFDFFKKIIPKI